MIRSALTAIVVSLVITGPAQSAIKVVDTGASSFISVPGANDFKAQISVNYGFDTIARNVNLQALSAGRIDFFYLGSESGTWTTFGWDGGSFQETVFGKENKFAAPVAIGSMLVAAGEIFGPKLSFVATKPFPGFPTLTSAVVPDDSFGVIHKAGVTTGNTFLFGYDVHGPAVKGDNDYDDMVIGAQFVSLIPEPAAWSLLLAGFGLSALSLRSRKRLLEHS